MPRIKVDEKGNVFISHPERHKVIPQVTLAFQIHRCKIEILKDERHLEKNCKSDMIIFHTQGIFNSILD